MPFREEEQPWLDEGHGSDDGPLPEIPADLLDAPHTADRLDVGREVPCDCECCAPDGRDDEVEPAPAATREHVLDTELAHTFKRQWTLAQQHTAAAWQAANLLHARALATGGTAAAEHVGSDLALQMNVHPRTGETVMVTAIQACTQVPQLAALVLAGELTVKHVDALLREAGKWTDDEGQAAHVVQLTLDGCRSRLDRYGWPTPSELKKRLAKVAILNDLQAQAKKRKSVADRRGVALWQSGSGQATLTIEGPDLMLIQAHRAIEARAHAMGRIPGDTRTLQQRMFDAAQELLIVDADGGQSAVPTTGLEGEPVTITVRGVEIVVLVPYSVLLGGDLELAEIDGYGPILPSTARQLADQAESMRRAAIDAETGQVITVDDATPARRRRRPASRATAPDEPHDADAGDVARGSDDEDPEGDSPTDEGPTSGPGGPGPDDSPPTPPLPAAPAGCDVPSFTDGDDVDPMPFAVGGGSPAAAVSEPVDATEPETPDLDATTRALLARLLATPVAVRDLGTFRYRAPGRLRRKVILRDRTCTFPGCTVPGRYVDIDHRDEFPRGATSEDNLHCLCRRHHRAKQAYFKVRLDSTTNDTCWTTPDGREYRRPPPTF